MRRPLPRPLSRAAHMPVIGLLAAALTLAALPARAADDATVVATVGGQPVTLGEMRVIHDGMGEQAAELPDAALWDLILDQITRQAAVAQTAEAGLGPRDEAALALQRRAYLANLALEKVASPEPAEDELKAAYDKAFGSAGEVTEYNAQHILVETEEAARAVEEELKAGKEFGRVAEERSTGPSGPNKGDLGWFTLDTMVPPFAEAVAKLGKGEISEPVQTDFGWHVIRLNDSRVKAAPAFDEVRDALSQQIRRDRVEAEIRRILGAATIEKTPGLSPELLRSE